MTNKPDICLTAHNSYRTAQHLLDGVEIICNKKRITKNAEVYFNCGGGYDTESTTVLNSEHKPKYAFVYHVQICINRQYIYFRDINLLTVFLSDLCEVIKYKKLKKAQPKLIIWVANLAHEWAFFKRQLVAVGITDIFAKTEREPLKICIQDCIEFRECIGLFGISLSNIADTYTTTKKLSGDLDYDLIRTQDTPLTETEYNYCKNDVVILDELSEVAFAKFTNNGLKIPMTKTGILRQKCKNAINKIMFEYRQNEKLMPKTEHEYYLMRRYMYAGGLSGTNPKYAGVFIKKSRCADITSDYPAQMNHHLYPAGELIEIDPNELYKYRHLFRIFIFTCNIDAKTSHAVLSTEKILNYKDTEDCPFCTLAKGCIVSNGKLLFGDNICLMLNNVDFAAYSELYEFSNMQVYKAYIFTEKKRTPTFLRKCMNDDYLIKADLKAKGLTDTLAYKESKIINAYYGMTATRLYENQCVYNDVKQDISEEKAPKTYAELREKMWLNPYIAYWCTSYARALLMHFIARYPDIILQYDTDSLYFITDTDVIPQKRLNEFLTELNNYNVKIALKNKRYFNNNNMYSDLGAWDIDKCDNIGFKGLGAKRYLIQKADGKYKPVVAGMVKESFFEYCENKRTDPFTLFRDTMTLNRVTSRKLASVYNDKADDMTDTCQKVTDYMGHETVVKIGTYHALYPIEFKMKVAHNLMYIGEMLRQEKAIPEHYRVLEKIVKEVDENENRK